MHDELEIGVVENAKLIEPPQIERAGAAIGSDDAITFVEQKLGQIGAVLSGNAGDQCDSH